MSGGKVPPPPPVTDAIPADASVAKLSPHGRLEGRTTVRIVGGDIARDPLRDAVFFSLFTWRRAEEDDRVPDAMGARQGWWADAAFGSRLYLLARSKVSNASLADARAYALEALQWMRDDGLVGEVGVRVERSAFGPGVSLEVTLHRPRLPADVVRYDMLWS